MSVPLLLVLLALCSVALAAPDRPPETGLRLWLDAAAAETTPVAADGALAEWRDRSGGDHHATRVTGSGAPRLVAGGLNGRPVLRFDGSAALVVAPLRPTGGPVTVFVVTQRSADQATGEAWQRLLGCWDGQTADDNKAPSFSLLAHPKGEPAAYAATVRSAQYQDVVLGALTIGGNGRHQGQKLRGDVAEVLVYDRAFLAFDDQQQVADYLAAKWGAASALDNQGWTRTGPLGETPPRTTDAFPLADQANRGGWVRYEPMSDEFDGAQLDRTKWHPTNPTWKGRQPALFWDRNVTVADGRLQLTMRQEEMPNTPRDQGYHTWTSAAVKSVGTVLYGYFEILARPMRSHGSSAFWFYDSTPELWTEIDVFELGGGAPGFEAKYNMNLHVFRTPEEKRHWSNGGVWVAPWPFADAFHVFGLGWTRDWIEYHVDGALVRKVKNTHWHQPLTMNFDSETMPSWFGLPRAEDLPSTFEIEYVRSWQQGGR